MAGLRVRPKRRDNMQKKMLLIAVTLAVIATAVVLIPSSDAAGEEIVQDDEVYCYNDHLTLKPYFDDVNSKWNATNDETGQSLTVVENSNGTASVDLTSHDKVTITQTVENEMAIVKVNALHVNIESFEVTFYDRDKVVRQYTIDTTYPVEVGTPFVITPEDPSRDGYEFKGWYVPGDDGGNSLFDPFAPLYGTTDVYAMWGSTTGSGSTNVGSHIVTFNCSPGLTYTLLDSGNGRVSFTVSELPDYQVIEGSIEVEANGNPVSPVDGVYTVTGINTDVLITIDGDLMFSGNPNDPALDDSGMPMWMWIMLVVVILLIAAAILWMRGRQVDQGRI